MSMGNHLMINLIQFAIPAQGIVNFNLTGVNDQVPLLSFILNCKLTDHLKFVLETESMFTVLVR